MIRHPSPDKAALDETLGQIGALYGIAEDTMLAQTGAAAEHPCR